MKPRKYFELILYLGLLAVASWNVHKTIIEYTTGSTSYLKSNEPITLHDLPTITFSYKELEPAEKDNFNVTVLVASDDLSNESIMLAQDRSIETKFGFEIQLRKLKPDHHFGSQNCYTISPKINRDIIPTIDIWGLSLYFKI